MKYTDSFYQYSRRKTRPVVIGDPENGGVVVGGDEPIVVQSMLTCSTLDTEACIQQSLDLVKVGCQMVRITAQTVRHAQNLEFIVSGLRAKGCLVPIVADIHFKPDAAMEAAKWVEVVRVNPGNFADSKKFKIREYTDGEYAEELTRIAEKFEPLVERCRELGRAIRIGTNHGSLSDRIMNRFGDTPLGMVESALEFARIARRLDFHNFKFSMKSSNPKVMIECYRLLVARLDALGEDWNYPIHLGVTEAGDGEDGRIKSAIGIGSLLCDGLGDTIRVSLTEDAPHEIPVCRELVALIPELTQKVSNAPGLEIPFDPFEFSRRASATADLVDGLRCGGDELIRVIVSNADSAELRSRIKENEDVRPEGAFDDLQVLEVDPREPLNEADEGRLIAVSDSVDMPLIAAYRLLAARLKAEAKRNPILLKDCLGEGNPDDSLSKGLLRSAVVIGSLLSDGIGDAIWVRANGSAMSRLRLAFNILQAAGCRSFKTDYVACPSCGRTLFDLQEVTARIRERTGHLKGVKIAVMGCIVNGPGEMADADFGYVGGAPGKINLYVGKTAVKFNIPSDEAVERLVDLIDEHGKWTEPAVVVNEG